MLHFCTSKTAYNIFGHLTFTTFSFSMDFVFCFFFLWLKLGDNSLHKCVTRSRMWLCACATPKKRTKYIYSTHPTLSWKFCGPARKLIFPQFSRFLAAVCVLCARSFLGVLRVLFRASESCSAHLLGVLVHRHKLCACV